MNYEHEWTSMLQADLGMSLVGFRNLLLNRHEMRDGAYLEECEKRLVEILRKKFAKGTDVVAWAASVKNIHGKHLIWFGWPG